MTSEMELALDRADIPANNPAVGGNFTAPNGALDFFGNGSTAYETKITTQQLQTAGAKKLAELEAEWQVHVEKHNRLVGLMASHQKRLIGHDDAIQTLQEGLGMNDEAVDKAREQIVQLREDSEAKAAEIEELRTKQNELEELVQKLATSSALTTCGGGSGPTRVIDVQNNWHKSAKWWIENLADPRDSLSHDSAAGRRTVVKALRARHELKGNCGLVMAMMPYLVLSSRNEQIGALCICIYEGRQNAYKVGDLAMVKTDTVIRGSKRLCKTSWGKCQMVGRYRGEKYPTKAGFLVRQLPASWRKSRVAFQVNTGGRGW